MHDDLPADRIFHPIADRLARLVAGVAAVPVIVGFALAQRLAGFAHGLAPARPGSLIPSVDPLPPVATPGEAFARIDALRFAPRRLGKARMIALGFPDWPLMVLSSKPALAQIGYRFPRAFRQRVLAGSGGEPISVLAALRTPPGATVLVVHGAMTTKHFDYVRRVCVRLWGAGFSVVAVDMRGFGGTSLASLAPNSLGSVEGEDLVVLAGWLRSQGATSVGALGFSLGGAAVLSAARITSERGEGIDGGVLALSPPSDMAVATARASVRPPVRDRFYPTWVTLVSATTGRARALGLTTERVTPADAVDRLATAFYGLSSEELARRGSAAGFIGAVTVPTLVLHAVDDVVVPVAHARALAAAAAGNPFVRVLELGAGGHTAFDAVDPVWTAAVELTWFRSFARS